MEIGQILKRIRVSRGLSLRELSQKSGVSPSFIGQIERNETSPSVRTLKALTDALDIRLGELFDGIERNGEVPSPLITPDKRRKIEYRGYGVEMYLLTPDLDRNLQLILIIAEPGGSTGEGFYTHEGEEAGIILSGSLCVQVGDTKYNLREGDSLSFKCSTPHRWENMGNAQSISVWAITPPSF